VKWGIQRAKEGLILGGVIRKYCFSNHLPSIKGKRTVKGGGYLFSIEITEGKTKVK
jgi:hypothetical protein